MEHKVLFTASTYSHIANFHRPYLRAFSALGWAVDVACGGKPMDLPEARRVIHLPLEKSITAPANFQAARMLRREMKKEGYALISTHTSLAAFFTRLAARELDTTVVNTCHGYLFDPDTPSFKGRLLLEAERLTAGRTDLLLTMNRRDREIAGHYRLGRRVLEIPGVGVDFSPLDQTPATARELLRAEWVKGAYKNIWIDQFRKMSTLAYERADLITSLYEHARELQVDLGCPAEKTMVTPNGVAVDHLQALPGKTEEDAGKFNIGAILRVTPIKDVKTMIQAFGFAKEREPRLKLWIMGPCDEDEAYAKECFEQVEALGLTDVVFTGRIDIRDYLGRMDVTILTSISEGQPLTILESYAAHVPVIATDVGNCSGLIFGENDDFGAGGILTHIMNVEEIAQAMVDMARNEPMRIQMGESGYKRVMAGYRIEHMRATYQKIYRDFADSLGLEWEM